MPTTSTLPKALDAVDTVAGPVGAAVTGAAQEEVWALTGELSCGITVTRANVSIATPVGTANTRLNQA